MKKFLALILAGVMSLSLVACGSNDATPDTGDKDNAGDSTTTYKLIVGSTVQDDSASGIALLDYFKPYVEEHSEGRITVEVQNNSVLGSDRELYEGLQMNTVQCSFGPMSTLANFAPDYAVCDLPFLFSDKDDAYANLDGEFGQKLAESLPNVGMRLLAYGENAFRNISNSKTPITKMEDMKGLKIRVMESPINIATYTAMGCNPTPMAFSELYTGLQQKTVDGQDNGVVLTYTSKLFEVQKYYTFTRHLYAANGMVFSEAFWQSLPEDLQNVVRDGSIYAMENQRRLNTEMEESLLVEMQEAGLEVNYMDDAEIARIREATVGVWDQFKGEISEEIYNMAVEIRDN